PLFEDEEWRRREKPFDVGESIVLPFLKAKGIRTIDKLILTHGHFDHIGGTYALIGEIKIKELLYAAGKVEGDYEKSLLNDLYRSGVKIVFVKEKMKWRQANYDFYILSPIGNENELNARSIVLYVKLGGLYWLFTGDLEEE